jgi:2-amino-4-hydroxy-6-hydroxymethyldihydropteridine diphosphokinase
MAGGRETICFVGIGSNQESPADRCREAIRRIAAVSGIKVTRNSSLYRTEPVGLLAQGWFINAVIEIRTALGARDLLAALRRIEDDMGRVRGAKWGPRIIDLDILLYGQDVMEEADMMIPHPELHRRRFVMAPLNEIASFVIHPAFGVSVGGLLDRLEDHSVVELYLAGRV